MDQLQHQDSKILQAEITSEKRKGSLAVKLTRGQRRGLLRNARICGVRPCDKVCKALNCRYKEKYSRKSCRNEKGNICHDAVDIYGVVALASLPVLGDALIGSIISWYTLPFDMYPGMLTSLKVVTMIFQASFAAVAMF